jgi:hypothetical protein
MTGTGRPTSYRAEIARRILDGLTSGHSLRTACQDAGISHTTALEWVRQDRDGFAERYREACRIGGGATTSCYTAEIAERILQQLSDDRTLVDICGDPGMPSTSTVRQWVAEDRDGFAGRYRRVRETIGNKAGRPTRYEDWIVEEMLDDMSGGRPLTRVCTDPLMPAPATVRHWAAEDRNGFAARYETARRLGCEALADEILRMADKRDCWISHRLPDGEMELIFDRRYVKRMLARITTRRWLLSKMLPRKCGNEA